MPLTKKWEKIMRAMKKEYGSEKGKHVFYASRNKGRIRGVDHARKNKSLRMGMEYKGHSMMS